MKLFIILICALFALAAAVVSADPVKPCPCSKCCCTKKSDCGCKVGESCTCSAQHTCEAPREVSKQR